MLPRSSPTTPARRRRSATSTRRSESASRRRRARRCDRLAYEEAASLYERALDVLDPGSAEERDQRCRLLIELARARLSAGNRTEGHRAAYAAADEAQATNQPDLLGEALLAIGGVRGWSEAGLVDEGLIGLAEEVLASIPTEDSRLRSCVTARLAGELYFDPSAHRSRGTR